MLVMQRLCINYKKEKMGVFKLIFDYLIPRLIKITISSCLQVSSVEIERITNAVDDSVHETAAIGVPPQGGGPERLVVAVVFKHSNVSTLDLDRLRVSFNSALQKKLNPLFKVLPALMKLAVFV